MPSETRKRVVREEVLRVPRETQCLDRRGCYLAIRGLPACPRKTGCGVRKSRGSAHWETIRERCDEMGFPIQLKGEGAHAE